MIFFDTNVPVYSTVNLDKDKQETSDTLIEQAIKDDEFLISPLVISEFIYVLTKLGIDKKLVENAIALYRPFTKYPVEAFMVFDVYKLCSDLEFCRNINDAVHVKFAEKHCDRIVTFDSDFKRFKDSTDLMIEIC